MVLQSQVSQNPLIVLSGGIITDLICYVPRFPVGGETIFGTKFAQGFGGKAGNQAVAASRLGAHVGLIGKVGSDSYGNDYKEMLKSVKIEENNVWVDVTASTGMAIITVDSNAENTVVVVPGANMNLTLSDVRNAEIAMKNAKVAVLSMEIPRHCALEFLQMAKQYNVRTITNCAPAFADLEEEFYKLSEIFCVNETELEILTGIKVNDRERAEAGGMKLVKLGCSIVIVTLGADGAMVCSNESMKGTHVGGRTTKAIDTTGAGDAFVGAVAYYLAYFPGLGIDEVVRRANVIASFSVEKEGTQSSFVHKIDLPLELYEQP